MATDALRAARDKLEKDTNEFEAIIEAMKEGLPHGKVPVTQEQIDTLNSILRRLKTEIWNTNVRLGDRAKTYPDEISDEK